MLIPLIPKNPDLNDFSCRDGEIEWIMEGYTPDRRPAGSPARAASPTLSLTPVGTYPTQNIRIPLENGDRQKAELLLSGDVSRVDPSTAERLTTAIVRKAAEVLIDLSTDLRRQGQFILPFRMFTMLRLPDGTLSYPSPQAVALPTDFPPHPEISAAAATDDCLTLALRFPVRPHRLTVVPPESSHADHSARTFISYPLYIPDPKEMRGSLGSVRSATGGNATGIRFTFLSASAIKASVAAPEKYYGIVGNERTGYRLSSKAAATPDYSCHADSSGRVAPFPRASLLALGDGVDAATDPLDWIADWIKADCTDEEEGYLPASLPHDLWHSGGDDASDGPDTYGVFWPDGINRDSAIETAATLGLPYMLLTRPMALTSSATSRRDAAPTAIRTIHVHGLAPDLPAHAILYGSDDCRRWQPLRRFDPRVESTVLTPKRHWWRLLLYAPDPPANHALRITHREQ